MTISLSDNELRQVMTAAANLPVEKRGVFLERIAASLRERRIALDKCIADALRGLRHGQL